MSGMMHCHIVCMLKMPQNPNPIHVACCAVNSQVGKAVKPWSLSWMLRLDWVNSCAPSTRQLHACFSLPTLTTATFPRYLHS